MTPIRPHQFVSKRSGDVAATTDFVAQRATSAAEPADAAKIDGVDRNGGADIAAHVVGAEKTPVTIIRPDPSQSPLATRLFSEQKFSPRAATRTALPNGLMQARADLVTRTATDLLLDADVKWTKKALPRETHFVEQPLATPDLDIISAKAMIPVGATNGAPTNPNGVPNFFIQRQRFTRELGEKRMTAKTEIAGPFSVVDGTLVTGLAPERAQRLAAHAHELLQNTNVSWGRDHIPYGTICLEVPVENSAQNLKDASVMIPLGQKGDHDPNFVSEFYLKRHRYTNEARFIVGKETAGPFALHNDGSIEGLQGAFIFRA
jgi:hypothetical protein